MALDFPSSPTNNQVYENYIYSASSGAWQKLPGNTFATTAISDTPPVNPANGDLWWNSADGKFYIYYSDGSSAQWVSAALPAVAVSDTPPAGYDGQMWLDSTDGSMYVYYTDPGGSSSSWIGAVSRSGGILQVVSANYSTETSTSSTSYVTTNLSASITPASTSSKIYALATFNSRKDDTNQIYYTIYRGDPSTGVRLGEVDNMGSQQSSGGAHNAFISLSYLDSPSTTSSTSYHVAFKISSGTPGKAFVGNRLGSITLIEVAG